MSKVSSSAAGASYRSDWTNVASIPRSAASARAAATASALKSRPVTFAPRRAQESVSSPKWHWRWSSVRPSTGPISSRS